MIDGAIQASIVRKAAHVGRLKVAADVMSCCNTSAQSRPSSSSNSDLSWLDQIRIETCVEARVADVCAGVGTESDQAELRGRKPLTQTTSQVYPVHPRH